MHQQQKIRIAYLIPEWPGQTHIWMWREICHLRDFGTEVFIYATRPPPARDRARHAFADHAASETRYLWPRSPWQISLDILTTVLRFPVGFCKSLWQSIRLAITTSASWQSSLSALLAAASMATITRRDKIDHVHLASAANSALIAMALRTITGTPYSVTVNSDLSVWRGALREKFSAARFIVTHARWLQEEIRNTFPSVDPNRVVLAPVGVDTATWKPTQRTWPEHGSPLMLISVGRLHVCKGHDVTIRAVSQLVNEGLPVRLRILGDGPHRQALEQLIRDLNLADTVALLGSVDEATVRRELESGHIFVLASQAEPLGVVYMEAMATAIPTIGTAAGGVTEIIDHGRSGFLVPPNNAQALADCIRQINHTQQHSTAIGQHGRLTIETRFDSRIGARRLLEAFTSPAFSDTTLDG